MDYPDRNPEDPSLEPLPAIRPEPAITDDVSPQLNFLYRVVESFERSIQFADAKAGGVVLILGIGIADLLRNVHEFLDARHASLGWGWMSAICGLLAVVAGLLAVAQVGRALFPRSRPGLGSLFFWGVVSRFPSPKEYGDEVWFARERDLVSTMSTQAWNLAGISVDKYTHLRVAYHAALAFASFWALARLGLSLSQ